MKTVRIIRMAFTSLKINRMRTFLSTLGVIIGVASLILITSVGYGAQYSILSSIQSLGSNVVIVTPGKKTNLLKTAMSGTSVTLKPLTYEDVKYLKKKLPNVPISPESFIGVNVKYGNLTISTTVAGTNADAFFVLNYKIDRGRRLTDADVDGYRNVCILGATTKKNLFGDVDPIGKYIKINNIKYLVVGTLKSVGSVGTTNFDDIIVVPITTFQAHTGIKGIDIISAKAENDMPMDVLGARIKALLLARHGTENFSLSSEQQYIDLAKKTTDTLNLMLAIIGSIALIVGGIGIMNIMLASVAERTREIGIRKAVGAKNSDILLQFLTESTLISVGGGIIGIIIGIVLSLLIPESFMPTRITTTSIIVGFSVSVFIGIFFGVYPSRKASLLNPVEALRYE